MEPVIQTPYLSKHLQSEYTFTLSYKQMHTCWMCTNSLEKDELFLLEKDELLYFRK